MRSALVLLLALAANALPVDEFDARLNQLEHKINTVRVASLDRNDDEVRSHEHTMDDMPTPRFARARVFLTAPTRAPNAPQVASLYGPPKDTISCKLAFYTCMFTPLCMRLGPSDADGGYLIKMGMAALKKGCGLKSTAL